MSSAIKSAQKVSPSVSKSSESLWEFALSNIDLKDREILEANASDKRTIVANLSQIVLEAEETCISKQWRYKRNNGEIVNFRDVIAKITKWVERFKTIGDTAVQYDPIHAALPWAGVRFLLEIAVGHVGQFDFLVEGAEMIAYRIDRCAILESIYFSSNSPTLAKLKDSLTILYTAILKYLVKAKYYFQQKTAIRVLKAAIVPKTDFELLAANIVVAQNYINECTALIDAEISKGVSEDLAALSMEQSANSGLLRMILDEIDGPFHRINLQMQEIQDQFNITQRIGTLDRISSEPYLAYHKQNHNGVLDGTGQWLLNDPLFINWRRGSVSSPLWLHGMSGTGKTKVVSVVVQDLLDQSDADQGVRPVFFYCSKDNQEPARSNPNAILGSIARQLSSVKPGSPILPPTSSLIQPTGHFDSRKCSTGELTDLIIQLIAYYPINTIILDALDECSRDDRCLLLDAIHDILTRSTSLVKIFLSSREEGDLTDELRDYPNLRISSTENSRDIEIFIRTETERLVTRGRLLRNSMAKEEIKNRIIEKLIKGANGMFRWVTLKLETLARRRDEDILEQLERLPQKLTDLYRDAYQDLLKGKSDTKKSLIQNALKWLLCGRVSLSSNLFCVAITQNITPAICPTSLDEILDLCANFVIYDEGLDRFRFAHPSVQEFLQSRQEYTLERCHASVAECCLASILKVAGGPLIRQSLIDRSLYKPGRDKLPAMSMYVEEFGYYTIRYSIIHCKKASTLRSQGLLHDLFRNFFLGRQGEHSLLPIWVQWVPRFEVHFGLRRLHIALSEASKTSMTYPEKHRSLAFLIGCAYGFPEIVSHTLQDSIDNHVKANGLSLAVHNEQQEIITELKRRRQTFLTKDVLFAMLRELNIPEWKRDDLIQVFLDAGNVPSLLDAVTEWSCGSTSRMGLTLFCFADAAFANDDFLTKVVGKGKDPEMIPFILRQGGSCAITERVVSAATISLNHILRKAPMITPGIITAAITNPKFVMKSLEIIESRTGPLQMGLDMIRKVATCTENDVRQELLHNRELQVTPDLVRSVATGAGYSASFLKLLLAKCPDMTIAQDIFDVLIASRHWDTVEIIKILLEHGNRNFQITETNIKQALGHPGEILVPFLLSFCPDITITQDIFDVAIDSRHWNMVEIIKILLEHGNRNFQITENNIKQALGHSCREILVSLLLSFCPDITITQDIFDVAIDSQHLNMLSIIEILLEHGSRNFQITSELSEKLIRYALNGDLLESRLLRILSRHGHALEISAHSLQSAILTSAISIKDLSSKTMHRSELLSTPMPPQMDCLIWTRELFSSRHYSQVYHDMPDKDPSNFLRNLYTLFGPEDHLRITYDLLGKVPFQLKALSNMQVLLTYGKDVRVTYGILEQVTRLHQISYYAMNILWKRMIRDGNAEGVLVDALQHHLSGRNEHGSTAWALLLLWYKKSRNNMLSPPDVYVWQESQDLRSQLLTRLPHHNRLVENFCEKLDAWIADGHARV